MSTITQVSAKNVKLPDGTQSEVLTQLSRPGDGITHEGVDYEADANGMFDVPGHVADHQTKFPGWRIWKGEHFGSAHTGAAQSPAVSTEHRSLLLAAHARIDALEAHLKDMTGYEPPSSGAPAAEPVAEPEPLAPIVIPGFAPAAEPETEGTVVTDEGEPPAEDETPLITVADPPSTAEPAEANPAVGEEGEPPAAIV